MQVIHECNCEPVVFPCRHKKVFRKYNFCLRDAQKPVVGRFEVFDLSFGVDNVGDIIDEKGLSNFQDKVNIILFSIFSFSPWCQWFPTYIHRLGPLKIFQLKPS